MFFHGSEHKINSFTDGFVGGKEAHDQEGPGIYFTSSSKNARSYGPYIYTVKLHPKKLVSTQEGKSAPLKEIEWMLKNAPNWEMHAENFNENPNLGVKIAAKNILQYNDNPHQQFLQVWIDFYRNKPVDYVRNMVKLGYDAVKIEGLESIIAGESNITHIIVLNPSIIEFVEMEDDRNEEEKNINEVRKFVRKTLNENLIGEDYPTQFDMNLFKSLKTFKERIEYCEANLKKIGSGSSRIVYQVDNNKVLKLAKNKKGIAQNETEIDRGSGNYFSSILAQVFDSHPDGLWVEMEKAIPINKYEFRRLTEFKIEDVGAYLINFQDENNGKKTRFHQQKPLVDRLDNDEFIQQLREFVAGTDALAGDLGQASSYGVVRRNGSDELVLIDFGITTNIYQDFYTESLENKNFINENPLIAYHGTWWGKPPHTLKKTFHLGTLKAAIDRLTQEKIEGNVPALNSQPRIYSYEIIVKPDEEIYSDPMLHGEKTYKIGKQPIQYENDVEDKGSISYIVRTAQVKFLNEVPMVENIVNKKLKEKGLNENIEPNLNDNIVYHGTGELEKVKNALLDGSFIPFKSAGINIGIYVTPNYELASKYSSVANGNDKGVVALKFLRKPKLKHFPSSKEEYEYEKSFNPHNPKDATINFHKELLENGYDGIKSGEDVILILTDKINILKVIELQNNNIDEGEKEFETNLNDNFKSWFTGSKVVDANGNPMPVHHGTEKKFSKFNFKNALQKIIWFTSNKGAIESGDVGAAGQGHIMDLYASIKNPAGWDEYEKYGLDQLQGLGYDGAILPEPDGTFTGFVFEPNQLKSVKNKGEWNPGDKNIYKEDLEDGKKKLNKSIYHISSPRNRKLIDKKGIVPFRGGQWLSDTEIEGKAVFATNSDNPKDWFDSTYDDDVWKIDTTKIADVKWFMDPNFSWDKKYKHIYTKQTIPRSAIELIKKGTGNDLLEGGEFTDDYDLSKHNFNSGDCDIYAVSLHRLYGYPLYVVRGWFKDEFGEDGEFDFEDSHIVVKLSNGKFMDSEGETTEAELRQNTAYSNDIQKITFEPISEEEALSTFSCENQEPAIKQIMNYIKSKKDLKEISIKNKSETDKPYKFYLLCDKLCNLEGVEVKNKMIADATPVSRKEFVKNCAYAEDLFRYESNMRDDPSHGFYKSNVKGLPCYYMQYAGFEFIFLKDYQTGREYWLDENNSLKETYEADVAIEGVLHKALGDYFLENRDEILDNVYSTLSSRTANWAIDQLIEEYPDLEQYREEFIEAAVKEGYFEMTADKWESGELDEAHHKEEAWEKEIAQVAKQLKVELTNFIGAGVWGIAYEIPGNRVLKITEDDREVDNAKHLVGKKNKYMADIYKVYSIGRKKEKETSPFQFSAGKKVIVMEKLETLKGPLLKVIIAFSDAFDEYSNEENSWTEMLADGWDQGFNDFLEEKGLDDIYSDLLAIYEEAASKGIYLSDMHQENFGIKNGHLAIFDIT